MNQARSDDWAVISHLNAELGIGEIARRLMSMMVASGIGLKRIAFEGNKSRKFASMQATSARYNNDSHLLTCVNADQLGSVIALNGINPKNDFLHVGFWAWELENAPVSFAMIAQLLDEVWTISDYSMQSIRGAGVENVRVARVPVPLPLSPSVITKAYLGIPNNRFTILTSFDYNSDIKRKNPGASIEAYKTAFPKEEASILIIKSINGDRHDDERIDLMARAEGRRDIVFIDGYFEEQVNAALIEHSDVYLSLHRAEGYGLNIADAMARKTATIATGYSGNLEFTLENSGLLVPFQLVPVQRYAGIRVDSQWAEPDIGYAASKLRELYQNHDKVKSVAEAGFRHVSTEHSLAAASKRFKREFMNG